MLNEIANTNCSLIFAWLTINQWYHSRISYIQRSVTSNCYLFTKPPLHSWQNVLISMLPLTMAWNNIPCQTRSSRISVLAGQRKTEDIRQPFHTLALLVPTNLQPCCSPGENDKNVAILIVNLLHNRTQILTLNRGYSRHRFLFWIFRSC